MAQHNPVKAHGHYTQTAQTPAAIMKRNGFDCRPCSYGEGGRPKNPSRLDSISLVHMLMREGRLLIHADRCRELIHSFEAEECDARGLPTKVSGTASDRLSGPTDALRYLVWALFGEEFARPVKIL
jgi:hypothetical protein